jgi:hypothetical protein
MCFPFLHCGLGKKPDGILAAWGKNSGNKIFRGGKTESLFQNRNDLLDTSASLLTREPRRKRGLRYNSVMSKELLPAAAEDPKWAVAWAELGQGAPTIAGLAQVASWAMASGGDKAVVLSLEAKCLLVAARERGVIEVKGANRAFDAPGRMLAVYVEKDAEHTLIFRSRENPAVTIRFLAGFRELCAAGLAMHHIYTEFSLTREGLELAETISREEVEPLLGLAVVMGMLE